MKVGFIGLGNMGSAMAESLLKTAHEVTVYNRTPEKAQPLVEQGAHRAATVADTSKGDVVITMLADDSAVENVVFGDAGILANLRKGAIHVSSSTISVALSEKLNGGAYETGATVRCGTGVWTTRSCGGGEVVHRRCRRAGCAGHLHACVRSHGTENLPLW